MKKVNWVLIIVSVLLCTLVFTSVASSSLFTDVKANAYYAEAVQWAVDNGITTGTSSTTFSPNDTCTRAEVVTFLYRALKDKESELEDLKDKLLALEAKQKVENMTTAEITIQPVNQPLCTVRDFKLGSAPYGYYPTEVSWTAGDEVVTYRAKEGNVLIPVSFHMTGPASKYGEYYYNKERVTFEYLDMTMKSVYLRLIDGDTTYHPLDMFTWDELTSAGRPNGLTREGYVQGINGTVTAYIEVPEEVGFKIYQKSTDITLQYAETKDGVLDYNDSYYHCYLSYTFYDYNFTYGKVQMWTQYQWIYQIYPYGETFIPVDYDI